MIRVGVELVSFDDTGEIVSENSLFLPPIGCVAQLNRASDYGSEGFRFES